MVRPAPSCFNPELVARHSERLRVAFPLSRCKRLVALLAADSGELTGEFQVERAGRQLTIAGWFSTAYRLECQRCLNPYTESIESDFSFVLVPDEAAAEALPEDQDPLVLGEDGMLNVIDIFEDELILHIPTVPRHAEVEDCRFDVTVDILAEAGLADGAGLAEGKNASEVAGNRQPRGAEVFAELKKLRFDKE